MNLLRKISSLLLLIVLFSIEAFAQTKELHEVKGNIKNESTGEPVVGATIMYAPGKGTQTDIDGNYILKLPDSTYTFSVSYVGFQPQTSKIKVHGKSVILEFKLATTTLNEVEVVADIAKIRETPVAVSNITAKQIQEEIGARDLPMMLNSAPGVYATQQGGGSGDARINVRGFDQRYVAVMVDGIPVNDMENGQVYWSNWSGLSEITRTMQLQRGLGASRLAIPSVGGTMNIITASIDTKRSFSVKEEIGNNNMNRIGFGYNSGLIKEKFGVTLAGSYASGDGWVDQTWNKTWSYFAKFMYRVNSKNLITFGVNGAPQSHGQKYTRLKVPIYDATVANKLGVNSDSVLKSPLTGYANNVTGSRGLTYNPDWGMVNGKALNTSVNYFHKPLFNLSHFLTISEKSSLSTVLYASFGTGGGTYMISPPSNDTKGDGQLMLQNIYNANTSAGSIIPFFDPTMHQTSHYIVSSINNHQWYGLLSTYNLQLNSTIHLTGGVDGRYYMGTHYQTPYNLLGADYVTDPSNPNIGPIGKFPQLHIRKEGDKINYYNDSRVSWLGLFMQGEYKKDKFSAFATFTGNQTTYQNINYFGKKDVVFSKNNIAHNILGYGDTLYYDGQNYGVTSNPYGIPNANVITHNANGSITFKDNITNQNVTIASNYKTYNINSPEARTNTSAVKFYYGYTIKGGANYNLTEHQNLFLNIGDMSLVPKYNNVFDKNGLEQANIKNQFIHAIELGYGLKYQSFAANLNGYYTIWQNKPLDFAASTTDINGNLLYYNINGIDALHKGLELDFAYSLLVNLKVDVFGSLADWRYTSGNTTAYVYNSDGSLNKTVEFSANNVHVGNAAQNQLGGSLRYEPFKNFYIKPRITYFGKNYAQFDPGGLTVTYNPNGSILTDYRNHDSWRMPDYYFMELFAGYKIKLNKNRMELIFTGSIQNLLDNKYITDASFGYTTPNNYNATNALVYMSQGRRYNIGLTLKL